MKELILSYINKAGAVSNTELMDFIKELLTVLAGTYNAPSDWIDIGEKLAELIDEDSDIYEALELWEHQEGRRQVYTYRRIQGTQT